MSHYCDRCDDCGHTGFQHLGGACSGRIVFDDALDEGGFCGCDEFAECDCGCRDDDESCPDHGELAGACTGCADERQEA